MSGAMSSRTTCWFWHASNWPRANAPKKAGKLAPDRNRASLCRTFGINRGHYETQQVRNPAELTLVLPPEWPRLTKTGVSGRTLSMMSPEFPWEEGRKPAVAPLGDMMGNAGGHDACDTSHETRISILFPLTQGNN